MAPSVTRKRPAAVFFAALFAIVLYFGLFPYPLGLESVARTAWAVPVPQPADPVSSSAPADAASLARFQLGDLFGYIDPAGRFAHVEKTLYQVALSDAGYVNYTRLGTDWILLDPHGSRILSFSGSGYPALGADTGRVFVVKSDLSGITEIDRSGDALWTRDFPSLVTSLSMQGGFLLAGLLDGRLLLFGEQGSLLSAGAPPGSRVPVILGAAVTPDGRRAASVSGIDPQILTVYGRDSGALSSRATMKLSSDFRREVRVTFSPDGGLLAFEEPRGAGLFDPSRGRRVSVPLAGPVAGIAFQGRGRYAALVARAAAPADTADLFILNPFVGPVLRTSFPAKLLFVGSVDNGLLLGIDGRLVRIDVESL